MHVAIILDGNRRFAWKKGLPPTKGHYAGSKKVAEVIEWCLEEKIKMLTLYIFSKENFRRSRKEVDALFRLFRSNLHKLHKKSGAIRKDVRVMFIGQFNLLPHDIYKDMQILMEKTRNNKGMVVNFAIAYGGRAEIVDCVKEIVLLAKEDKIRKIDEGVITKHLYLTEDVDLIIRPGGEKRVSNFLLWQGYYAELYFTDVLWPEFSRADFSAALTSYKERERRYGL